MRTGNVFLCYANRITSDRLRLSNWWQSTMRMRIKFKRDAKVLLLLFFSLRHSLTLDFNPVISVGVCFPSRKTSVYSSFRVTFSTSFTVESRTMFDHSWSVSSYQYHFGPTAWTGHLKTLVVGGRQLHSINWWDVRGSTIRCWLDMTAADYSFVSMKLETIEVILASYFGVSLQVHPMTKTMQELKLFHFSSAISRWQNNMQNFEERPLFKGDACSWSLCGYRLRSHFTWWNNFNHKECEIWTNAASGNDQHVGTANGGGDSVRKKSGLVRKRKGTLNTVYNCECVCYLRQILIHT